MKAFDREAFLAAYKETFGSPEPGPRDGTSCAWKPEPPEAVRQAARVYPIEVTCVLTPTAAYKLIWA